MSLPIRNILSFFGNRDIDTPLLQACKQLYVVTGNEEELGFDSFEFERILRRHQSFYSGAEGDRMREYWQFMQRRVTNVCRCLIAANADVNARDYK
jgi:hypothetical protein